MSEKKEYITDEELIENFGDDVLFCDDYSEDIRDFIINERY